jgi:arylsulfatase A-like enzyme
LGSPKQKLDGKSLVPILKDYKYKWTRPGLTTTGEGYASIRSERYRYIRYPDGSEVLYDHRSDPYEHLNLAGKVTMKAVIAELSKNIPANFAKSLSEKSPRKKGKGGKTVDDGE